MTGQQSDECLYERYRRTRDREAFGVLFDRYFERLKFFLFDIVRQAEDAEELAMDTLAVVASLKSAFRGESGFGTWLFAIAKKLAYQHLLKRRHVFLPLRENIPDHAGPPDIALLREEKNLRIWQALEALRPAYREALHLKYYEGLSCEEIGYVTGRSTRQVYKLISRGSASLREKLKGMGLDDA